MRRCLLLLAWSLLSVLCLPTWAKAPVVRLSLDPAGPVELGTDLTLRVEVLVPTWFLDAPRFPESIEIPGAMAEMVKGSAENLSESIDGVTWAGLRRRYRIQPLNPGEFRLPELAVPLSYAQEGGKGPLAVTARGRLALPIQVRVPPAAARLDPFIAARQLRLSQRLERPEARLGVGDAVRRVVVLDTDAGTLDLPPTAWPEAPGMRRYVDPLRSRETRTDAAARPLLTREESATWVFERPGRYELPAVTLDWWDLAARRLRQARLPAIVLEVGPARSAAAFAMPEELAALAPAEGLTRQTLIRSIYGAGAVVLLLLGWHRVRRHGRRTWKGGRRLWQQWLAAEPLQFRRLIRACRRDDGSATQAALQRWLDACAAPAPGLRHWLLARAPATELAAALVELDAACYGAEAPRPWQGAALARQLVSVRRRLRRAAPPKAVTLPASLNP